MSIFPLYTSDSRGKAANTTFKPEGGLEMRDYIAIEAMKANRIRHSDYKNWDDLAKDSYEIADAMIKERAL